MSTATATNGRSNRTGDGAVASFYVGDDCFGIDANCVQEVLRNPVLTPVPHAPKEIEGLINLRGQVVIVISLRRRLGMGRPAAAVDLDVDLNVDLDEIVTNGQPAEAICVVLKTDDGPVCILVDKISDVLPAPEDLLEPPPDTISQEVRDHVIGVHKMEGKLLLILDLDRVVATTSLQEA